MCPSPLRHSASLLRSPQRIVPSFSNTLLSTLRSKPVVWFLTESAQLELELLRLAYAELLYRWGLDHDRLQVLKLCRSSSKNHGAYGPGFGADLVKTGNGLGAMAAIGAYQRKHVVADPES